MSAITPILSAITGGLITQILLIVASVAGLVGVGILVAYGFRHLRSAAGGYEYAPGESMFTSKEEHDDNMWG